MSKLFLLRFALIIPAAMVGWYLGLMLGIAIYELGEATCPREYVVSGACFAPWTSSVHNVATGAGASAAATLIVLFAYWLAPTHKRKVALIALMTGAGAATIMLILTKGAWIAYVFALTGGSVTYLMLARARPSVTTD